MFKWLRRLFGKKQATIIEHPEVIEPKAEDVKEEVPVRIYYTFTEEDKNNLADIIRPIAKAYNNELKEEFVKFVGDDVKTLKTFTKLVEDDMLLIFSFTQSENYNRFIENFVSSNIYNTFCKCIDLERYITHTNDGKIFVQKINE